MTTAPALLVLVALLAGPALPVLAVADDPAVTWIAGERATPIPAATATEGHHTVSILIISFSSRFMVIKGKQSPVRITNASPEFRIALSPDEDADVSKRSQSIVLVKLKPNKDVREVRYGRDEDAPFNKDDLLPITVEPGQSASPTSPTSSITHRVVITGKLKPGEYAIAFGGRLYDFGID